MAFSDTGRDTMLGAIPNTLYVGLSSTTPTSLDASRNMVDGATMDFAIGAIDFNL